MVFVLVGQPGGNASVMLPSGMQMPMTEVQPGVYEGRYQVQWGEDPQALMQVFGALQVANSTTTTQLENRATAATTTPRGWGFGRR